jgi:hypothetical protein
VDLVISGGALKIRGHRSASFMSREAVRVSETGRKLPVLYPEAVRRWGRSLRIIGPNVPSFSRLLQIRKTTGLLS